MTDSVSIETYNKLVAEFNQLALKADALVETEQRLAAATARAESLEKERDIWIKEAGDAVDRALTATARAEAAERDFVGISEKLTQAGLDREAAQADCDLWKEQCDGWQAKAAEARREVLDDIIEDVLTAVMQCKSLDENGYIADKSKIVEAIRALADMKQGGNSA